MEAFPPWGPRLAPTAHMPDGLRRAASIVELHLAWSTTLANASACTSMIENEFFAVHQRPNEIFKCGFFVGFIVQVIDRNSFLFV